MSTQFPPNGSRGRPPWLVVVLAVLALLVGGGAITVAVTDDGTNKQVKVSVDRSPAIGETTAVDTADPDNKPDTDLKLTERAENVAQGFVNNPKDLSNAGPVPLSGTGVQKGVGKVPFPMAADELAPCRTRFLQTNFSSRGVSPGQVVLFEFHYTAGPDIPNSRADVDGLTAFGNRASSRVSWHINMDKDGNCDYNVPLRLKAWTIANLNPVTINVEVAGRGEAPYLREGGYRSMAAVIKQVRRAYPGIKLQIGASSNCRPTRGGFDTHWRGGPCSGGHSDIKPLALEQVVAKLKTYLAPAPITKEQRARCGELNRLRRKAARPHTTLSKRERARGKAIKAGERKNGLRCLYPPKPHRRELVRR